MSSSSAARLLEARQGRPGSSLGGNTELFIEFLIGRTGAKPMHPDKCAAAPYIALPAERRSGFYRNLNGCGLEGAAAILLGLLVEQLGTRHGDHARTDVAALQQLAGGHGDL